MSEHRPSRYRELALQLVQRSRSGRAGRAVVVGPEAGGDMADSGWHHVYDRLGPVIGTAGFRALVDRSLSEAGNRFDFLSGVSLPDPPAPIIPELARAFRMDPEQGEEAALETLGVFLHHLESLLGDELAARLLGLEGHDPGEGS